MFNAALLGAAATLLAVLALLRLVGPAPAFERYYYATIYAAMATGLGIALFQVPIS